jgi:hypothetical protein
MQPGYAPPFADETDPGRLVKYYIHVLYSQQGMTRETRNKPCIA